MDKAYKSLFLRYVKKLMKAEFPDFIPFKLERGDSAAEVFSGSLMYRRELARNRFVWIIWVPGPGVERYFNVELGWSVGCEGGPTACLSQEQAISMISARVAVPGVAGGTLDLEAMEGKNAIGGIPIPSPWDQLDQIKASAPQSVQREAQLKAFVEASALSDEDRQRVIEKTLASVADRIRVQLPGFVFSIDSL